MTNKEYGKYGRIFSIILAVIIAGFFFYNYDKIANILKQISYSWALSGMAFYLVNYTFRGLRLKAVAGSRINYFNEALNFSVLHGIFSYFFPARTGDASLPVLLKSTGKLELKKGVSVLLKTRVFDVTILGCLSLFACAFGAREISGHTQFIWFLAGMLMTSSFFIYSKLGAGGSLLLKRFFSFGDPYNEMFNFKFNEFFYSFLIWLSVFSSQYCMIQSIGLDLSFSEVVFLSTIQFPLQLLPIQGVANSGNHEGAWVTALVLMGFKADSALSFALASHGVLIVYVLLLGIVALFTGNKKLGSFINEKWSSIANKSLI